MRRKELERAVTDAVSPRLEAGEQLIGTAAVWVTTPSSRIQRLVATRHLLPAAVTERRLVLFRPPKKGHIDPRAVALEVPLAQITLDRVGRLPLLQVRLRAGGAREIVVEFRPRDRRLGRELASAVGGAPENPPESHLPIDA